MQTRQRLSLSLPIELIWFIQSFAKWNKKTQSSIIEDALNIYKNIINQKELKDAYIEEAKNEDDFSDIAMLSYYNDFVGVFCSKKTEPNHLSKDSWI